MPRAPTLDGNTIEDTSDVASGRGPVCPGALVVFSGDVAMFRVARAPAGTVRLGREGVAGSLPDVRASRDHVELQLGHDGWTATDLGSKNGTAVDGLRVEAGVPTRVNRLVRFGASLAIPVADVTPFENAPTTEREGLVVGARLAMALSSVERVARAGGDAILIQGESGSGKEHVARAFHHASGRKGAFVAVNGATIPEGVAERVLFGAKRGAFSGATADADGFFQAADGGVLFLDEIGELSLEVQAKLLRVLETGDVLPVGATVPRKVDVALVTATHKDLRKASAEDAFRSDLYYRIARARVALPPLRERPEEIPLLLARAAAREPSAPTLHVSFVESCLLRPWPGNVRELLSALGQAVVAAGDQNVIRASHLDPMAGMPLGGPRPRPIVESLMPPPLGAAPAATSYESAPPPPPGLSSADSAERARMLDALTKSAGNQTEAAKALGIPRRTFLHRLDRFGIPRPRKGPTDDDDG